MKAKVELTADAVRKAIEEGKPGSMAELAHGLGYSGSVSSWLRAKLAGLVPDLAERLAEGKAKGGDGKSEAAEPKAKRAPKGKPAKGDRKGKAKPAAKAEGKWTRDPRNVFREGSAYAACFDILAAHKDGMPREKLVELLAEATGKDAKHAAYDAQVVLSARPNEDGLDNNQGPRSRSCRPGFWVQRTNGHVKLVVD